MPVGLANLLTEHLLPGLGCLELETHTGVVFCFFWWQTDPTFESPRPSEFSGQWMGGKTILMEGFGFVWTGSLLSHFWLPEDSLL